MTTPYYQDDLVTLMLGDSLAVLRDMPDASADCCVTSPPYFGLPDYGIEGQYGLEASPAEYVETMRALFAEARRVLANDGTLWLNLGDSYVGSNATSAKRDKDAAGVTRPRALGLTIDTLHEAAREIRRDVAHERWDDVPFALAVADWLDRTARNLPVGDNGGPAVLPGSTYEAAVAVARAYLGESS